MPQTTPMPEASQFTDPPATLAGLWSAVSRTHDLAADLCAQPSLAPDQAASDPSDDGLAEFVRHCAEAAEGLSGLRHLEPEGDRRPMAAGSAGHRPDDATADLDLLAEQCLDLAVEVLANEDEPLTPAEILAITRAVSCLCSARMIAPGGHA